MLTDLRYGRYYRLTGVYNVISTARGLQVLFCIYTFSDFGIRDFHYKKMYNGTDEITLISSHIAISMPMTLTPLCLVQLREEVTK